MKCFVVVELFVELLCGQDLSSMFPSQCAKSVNPKLYTNIGYLLERSMANWLQRWISIVRSWVQSWVESRGGVALSSKFESRGGVTLSSDPGFESSVNVSIVYDFFYFGILINFNSDITL